MTGLIWLIAKQKNLDNTNFIHGDCEDLPFAKDSFDVITCSMSFHHYPNADKFLKSCNRVLRPRGRLIIRDITGPGAMLWFMNHIELPIINKVFRKGDVHIYIIKVS